MVRLQENSFLFWRFYCGKDSESKRSFPLEHGQF